MFKNYFEMIYTRSLIHIVMQNEIPTRMCEPPNQKSMHLPAWIKASPLGQWGTERLLHAVPATLPLSCSAAISKSQGSGGQA